MLKPRDIDRDDAGVFARAAAIDAQRRNTNAKSLFSTAQITQGIRMRDALADCYRYDEIYVNYRPGRAPSYRTRCIAIKLEGYTVSDRKKLKFLMDGWKLDTSIVVDPVRTPQALIYRIYFT